MNIEQLGKIKAFKKTSGKISNLLVTKNENAATIYIYDMIDSWFGISASSIVETVNRLLQEGIQSLTVRINSPGGDVFEGLAIYNFLKSLSIPVTTQVDGAAYSIASVILLAGKEALAMPHSLVMIHKPWSYAIGTADDMRKMADVLDKHEQVIIDLYKEETELEEEELRRMMSVETYLNSEEALEKGFITKIIEVDPVPTEEAPYEELQNHAKNLLNAFYPQKPLKDNSIPKKSTAQLKADALLRITEAQTA